MKIHGAFSESYHRIVTGRAQIEVYVLGNVESLTTSTDILVVFSFLHHVPWTSTLSPPPLSSRLHGQATSSQLISKSSLRLRKNLPCQLPHAVANTSLNLKNRNTGLLTPKRAALFQTQMNGNDINEEECSLGQGPQLVYSLRRLTMEGIQENVGAVAGEGCP